MNLGIVMRCVVFAFAVVSLMITSAYAYADIQANLHWCKSGATDPERRIAACTSLLNSGELAEENYPSTHNFRGIAYRKKRLYDQAIRDYDEASRRNPDYTTSYPNRGYA